MGAEGKPEVADVNFQIRCDCDVFRLSGSSGYTNDEREPQMRRWCIIVLLDGYPVCSLLRTREKSYPCSTNLAMAKGKLGAYTSPAYLFAVRVAAWGWCYWTWCRRVRHGVSVASPERACGPFLDKQIDLVLRGLKNLDF